MAFRPSLSSPRLFLESVSFLAVVRSSVRQCRVYSSGAGGRGEAPTTARGRRMQRTALLRRNRRDPELERAARTGTCKTFLLPKSCTHSPPPPPPPFLSLSVSAPLTQDFYPHPGYFIPPRIFYPTPGIFYSTGDINYPTPGIFYPAQDILSHPGY